MEQRTGQVIGHSFADRRIQCLRQTLQHSNARSLQSNLDKYSDMKLQSLMGSMLTSMQRALERDDDVYLQLN